MLSFRKTDGFVAQLKQKLQAIPINSLAAQSGFVKRKPRKITPLIFLLGFFIMALSGGSSLATFATTIGLLSDLYISKQAVDKRIKEPLLKFLKSVLAATLSHGIKLKCESVYGTILAAFNRVLVEDSTNITVDPKLAAYFPGSNNRTKKRSAILKIQAVFELLSERFCYFDVTAFTKNDQRAAMDILPIVRAGDLIIRDLGYFVLPVLAQIQRKGAYFLSRLKYGISIYRADGETPFDLLKALRRYGQLDVDVCLGSQEKLYARLVAIPVPEKVAAERRRKAKANRDRRLNPSKRHLALLGWDIFVLNVDREILNVKQIAEIYRLRWRIETVFKSWKSHFRMANVPKASAVRVRSYIYAMLIFITIFQAYVFARLYGENYQRNNRQLSLIKLSKFFTEQIWAIILFYQEPERLKKQISYHCRYESRRDRLNYAQKILALS